MAANSSSRFFGTLALTCVLMGALFAFDTFLANTEKTESDVEAKRLFREGRQMLDQGDAPGAIDRFQNALTVARNDRLYQLALAEALLRANKLRDAMSEAGQILAVDSTNSRANLILARTLVRQGSIAEALSYYHRAIYGHWDSDAARQRLEVRWELVDLLAHQNANQELLSELLPLETEAGDNIDMRRRIAHLYQKVGFPERADQIFRDLVRRDPSDADAYSGLGEAEFSRADYRGACRAFRSAVRLQAENGTGRGRLDLCEEILSIDPADRGISADERSRRSLNLVERSLDSLTNCAAGSVSGLPAAQDLIDQARGLLKHPPRSPAADAVEANLQLAQQLWQERIKQCGQASDRGDQALTLVLKKAAQ